MALLDVLIDFTSQIKRGPKSRIMLRLASSLMFCNLNDSN